MPGGMSSSERARPGMVPGRSVVVKYPQLYRKGAVSSGGRSAEVALYEGRYGRQVFDASNLDFRGSGFAASGVVVPESGAHVPLRPNAGVVVVLRRRFRRLRCRVLMFRRLLRWRVLVLLVVLRRFR